MQNVSSFLGGLLIRGNQLSKLIKPLSREAFLGDYVKNRSLEVKQESAGNLSHLQQFTVRRNHVNCGRSIADAVGHNLRLLRRFGPIRQIIISKIVQAFTEKEQKRRETKKPRGV